MKQEDKDLLLKELCAGLPYGVKVNAPFTSNKKENAKGYKINSINFGVVEWAPTLFGEKKRRNSIIIEAFSEKYNQYCSIDLELDNNIEEVRPYLFPLSSMTEEQFLELTELCDMYDNYHDYNPYEYWGVQVCRKHIHGNKPCFSNNYKAIDWLNRNHFDYRGLISKGLAIDCTNLNIY